MKPEEIAAQEAAAAAAKEAEAKAAEEAAKAKANPPSPVEEELNRVKKRETKTEAEKAAYSLKKNAERLKELGGDPKAVLGLDETPLDNSDDATPVTVGMLKKIEAEKSQMTSLQMADDIVDVHERDLTKHHLEHTIRPSGDPARDLEAARAIVNSVKNGQIAEEAQRKTIAKRTSGAGAGAPGKHEQPIELTAEELRFTRPPFKLTPEEIVKTRRN